MKDDTKEVIDWDVLRRLERSMDTHLVHRLLDSFILTLQESRQEIARAAQNRDQAALRYHFHLLHGSAASIGAKEFAHLCKSLELSDKTPDALDEFIAQTERLLKALQHQDVFPR